MERAYPGLTDGGQKPLLLDNFSRKLNSNPNLAFAVRQRKPSNIDEAVAAALELETYLTAIAPTAISSVETQVGAGGGR